MGNLAANRSTTRDNSPIFRASYPIEDNVHIYQGALVQVNANGFAVPAGVATAVDTSAYKTVGRAIREYDNTVQGHAQSAFIVEVEYGIMEWDNLAGDLVVQADMGALCYAHDDHTVAHTNTSSHYAAAGRVIGLTTLPGFAGQQVKVFTIPGTP